MSSDFFKVKKGLNIQPTDPSGLSGLQDGDIIIDSTDDNRMKVYDSVGGDFSSVGTGGASGNILSDIEKLTPVVSNVVATTDTVTFLPIDDNNKSVKATFSGSDGSIRYESPASADLDGVQGLVKVWIKTDVDNLTLVATKDTVAQNNGVVINSTGKWRQYEIPVVLGDADYGFEIQASGAVAGDVYIDEAVVTVEAVIREVGQAQFVGSVTINGSNCSHTTSPAIAGTYQSFSVNNDCNYSSVGNLEAPLTKLPAIKIPNARTDGSYLVKFNGTFFNNNTNYTCSFTLSSTGDYQDGNAVTYLPSGYAATGTSIDDRFRFSTVGDKQVEILFSSNNTLGQCRILAESNIAPRRDSKFNVYFYPDASSTIVTQDTELTAKTANEFTLRFQNGGVNIVDDYNILDGNCTVSGTNNETKICTFNQNIFSETPSVVASVCDIGASGADVSVAVSSISSAGFRVTTRNLTNTGEDAYWCATVTKAGADVNKSQTIVGKFENINSTKNDSLSYTGTTSTTVNISTDTTWSTKIKDVNNSWNGTQYSPSKTSMCLIDGSFQFTSTSADNIFLYKDGVQFRIIGDRGSSTIRRFHYLGEFEEGANYSIRTGTNTIFDNSNHFMSIQCASDYESIIANLSNQKTKCQTKILSGSVATTGNLADVTFSNLTIGKRYQYTANFRLSETSTASNEKYGLVNISNHSDGLQNRLEDSYTRVTTTRHQATLNLNGKFIAAETSLVPRFTNVSNIQIAAGSAAYSFVELCELPDTYVETDEW